MDQVNDDRYEGINIILLLGVVVIGFVVVGPLIGAMVAIPFFGGSIEDFMAALTNPLDHPEIKIPFFITQGFTTLIGLIVAPLVLLMGIRKRPSLYFSAPSSQEMLYLLAVPITIGFMIVNSPFIQWNANIHFPEVLSSFEDWARAREDFAMAVTEFLTTFSSIGELIMGLLVIAVLPALGEEFVFRGLLQPLLHRHTHNIHAAIWLSAILFSAMHLQFFGFVPRVLLGGLFGYLFFWSGNLWIAILAHFVNNGFSVVMLYLYQQGKSDLDMNSTEAAPWGLVAGASLFTFALLYFFKRHSTQPSSSL
jgi:membrane protease YdiL (CAAX protease family)